MRSLLKLSSTTQVVVIFLTSFILSYILWKLEFKGALNFIWIIAFPLIFAYICNDSQEGRLRMMVFLGSVKGMWQVAGVAGNGLG